MASENVEDWDNPLPSTSSTIKTEGEEEDVDEKQKQYDEHLQKLQKYVNRMAYRTVEPPLASERIEKMSHPKKVVLTDNYQIFGDYLDPRLRKQRMARMTGKYTAISTEQLERIIKGQKAKERKKDNIHKKKQELYYEMLTKLEQQCRTQYLNVLLKKFASFIAKLATTMRIPPQLIEPYSRMQRGIFCNILLAIGVQPSNQAAIYYTSEEALEYEVCHKLAHALLSLIIKVLDSASVMNPDDIKSPESDFEMDNYIKDRLMCAAEKKILSSRQSKPQPNPIQVALKKCQFAFNRC